MRVSIARAAHRHTRNRYSARACGYARARWCRRSGASRRGCTRAHTRARTRALEHALGMAERGMPGTRGESEDARVRVGLNMREGKAGAIWEKSGASALSIEAPLGCERTAPPGS
jgi:hypothetical protein